jgi:hypothetical protein
MIATAIRQKEAFEATMKAMIIYEEPDSAKKASALLKRASDRADAATQWSVMPWRLDMLSRPSLALEALMDAAEAHLIVLTVRSQATLAPGLLNWLEAWAARRKVQDAALAVCDGGSGNSLSATATPELSEFARRHGLSIIVGDVCAHEDASPLFAQDQHERNAAQTSTMVALLEQVSPGNYQHWGINE